MEELLIAIDLAATERKVLWQGLAQWGGPAHLTDSTAVAMGFEDRDDFYRNQERLMEAVDRGDPLTAQDWRRALIATEIDFVSDMLGTGYEWETVTGLDDVDTIQILRGLQRKILHEIVKRSDEDIGATPEQ